MKGDQYQELLDELNGVVRLSDVCSLCDLRVSGVGKSKGQAKGRLRNNMRLHQMNSRCAKRQRAQKENPHA